MEVAYVRCLVVIAICGAGPALAGGGRQGATASCPTVRAHFFERPEILETMPPQETYDENLLLCAVENHVAEQRHTCCTEQTEQAFMAQAWRDYNDSVHQETRIVRSLFGKTTTTFRDGFMEMVDRSERLTQQAFVESFGAFTKADKSAVDRFFSNLRDVLLLRGSAGVVEVKAAADVLLDHVFASAFFHQHVQSSEAGNRGQHALSEFSHEYGVCVQRSRQVITGLTVGAGVEGFVARLARGMSAAAGLTNALELAIETLDTAAERAPLTVDCIKDVVKMSYCGACYGHPVEKPCAEFCADVLGVCMSELRKLERFWDYHLNALRMLVEFTLRQGYVQALLSSVGDELISGASRNIRSLYGASNSAILYDQVVSTCGRPLVRVAQSDSVIELPTSSGDVGDSSQELNVEVKKFLMLLDSELRGFFGRLPPSLCMTEKYYDTTAGQRCWEGLITKTDGKAKRLQFLQELAPKPLPLDSLEALKKKLVTLRKEYLDNFPRREPKVPQDSEDDGPDSSGAGSGSSSIDSGQPERNEPTNYLPQQKHHNSGIQSLTTAGLRPASAANDDAPATAATPPAPPARGAMPAQPKPANTRVEEPVTDAAPPNSNGASRTALPATVTPLLLMAVTATRLLCGLAAPVLVVWRRSSA